ncbi:uncharacterized protein FIBRA_05410 [Fibroporia radiculosa]|uniref:LIM zinc-binding domain-containing protein n=1 Tax=Fibroporia radiculosa TaxID=599839 RepID=J4HXG9_9APHY|nr:uncharacterized protein FIBRA_05410 [Fibroporia radiculosa]CCM03282.1 predicted protein [Fibroporia radiculosa]
MAQNTYYSQAHYDANAGSYSYSSYPQQSQQYDHVSPPSYSRYPVQEQGNQPAHMNTSPMYSTQSHSPVPPLQPVVYGYPPYAQPPYMPSPYDSRGSTQQHIPSMSISTRRPLPDPHNGSLTSNGHVSPRPASSPAPRSPSHRPTQSASSILISRNSPSIPASPPKSTPAISPPRPLPQPRPQGLPRSSAQSNLARSPSPTRTNRVETPQPTGMPTGQKFVPHWKRALPAPSQPMVAVSSSSPGQQPVERRSTVSGSTPPPILQRTTSTTRRPLPKSPAPSASGHERSSSHPLPPIPIMPTVPNTSSHQPSHSRDGSSRVLPNVPPHSQRPSTSVSGSSTNTSDDEDLTTHALLSRPTAGTSRVSSEVSDDRQSPKYGILELPSRTRLAQGSDRASDLGEHAQSATLRMAASYLGDNRSPTQSVHAFNHDTTPSRPLSRGHVYSQSVPEASAALKYGQMPASPKGSTTSASSRWPAHLPPLPKAPDPRDGGRESPTRDSRRPFFGGSTPQSPRRSPTVDLNLDDAPPPSLRRSPSPALSNPYSLASQSSHSANSPSGGKPFPPTSIRTSSLDRAPAPRNTVSPFQTANTSSPLSPWSSSRVHSPVSPASATSVSSTFTLSAFPRPPSSSVPSSRPLPSTRVTSPPVVSPVSAASTGSSVTSLSSFPQPPPRSPAHDAFDGQNKNTLAGGNISGASTRQTIPKISFPASIDEDDSEDSDGGFGPVISVAGANDDDPGIPSISIGVADDSSPVLPQISLSGESIKPMKKQSPLERLIRKGPGLTCGGCGGAIVGRTVSAMGARWHPGCFRCCVCDELLEHLSSYEHEGRAYCHFDYHELFAPKCYHCKTSIVDERFITLDDPELGKRTYHEQHFFCAECGDPFLAPAAPSRATSGGQIFSGDGEFSGGGEDDVGFTVYRGHPYCEACHVRLRLPKCKRCKKPIRDGKRAVEALGGKWCWECFVCASCEQPFEDPSFFQRDGEPFCERCFSIMIRNEL